MFRIGLFLTIPIIPLMFWNHDFMYMIPACTIGAYVGALLGHTLYKETTFLELYNPWPWTEFYRGFSMAILCYLFVTHIGKYL